MKETFPKNQQIESTREEKKENHEIKGMIKLILDDKEYELETLSYNFEYPERIQKETGIIGYERTKIPISSLLELVKHKFNSIGEINNIVLNSLSGGEYPDLCYTHVMAAYTDMSNEMNQDFKNDRFFLQKIYDLKRIEKNDSNYGYGNHGSSFSLYEDDGDVINKNCEMKSIINRNEIKENTAFAAMPKSGLNFWMGNFWRIEKKNIKNPTFGIPFRLDTFQEKYIEKSLETFCKIEKSELENLSKKDEIPTPNNSKILKNLEDFRGINGTIIMYALNAYLKNHPDYITKYKIYDEDFDILNLISDAYFNSQKGVENEKVEDFRKEFGNIINKFLTDNNIILKDNSYNILGLLSIMRRSEVNLPVFINHKELPQVSWGYAKYAHYANDQTLNFIKLKHADHLPDQNLINS